MPGSAATARWCRVGLAAVLALGGCRCDRGSTLQDKYGELVIVTRTVDGDEVLSRDATFVMDPVPMGTVGAAAVTLRNIGSGTVTLTHVVQASGDEGFAAEVPAPSVLKAGTELPLTITFAAVQAADPSVEAVASQARFQLEVEGAGPREETASVTVGASAVAKDCFVPATVDFGLAPLGLRVTVGERALQRLARGRHGERGFAHRRRRPGVRRRAGRRGRGDRGRRPGADARLHAHRSARLRRDPHGAPRRHLPCGHGSPRGPGLARRGGVGAGVPRLRAPPPRRPRGPARPRSPTAPARRSR